MSSSQGIYLTDLLEANIANDTDILVLETSENTKKISFRNLRRSLISDLETPSGNRIYSSAKVDRLIKESAENVNVLVGNVNSSIESLQKSKVDSSVFNNAINNLDNAKLNKEKIEPILQELANTRKNTDKISGKDLAHAVEEDKIHLEHLGQDVLNALTGSAPITVPAVPEGGWIAEDIANGAIVAKKLAKNYNYRGTMGEYDLNRLVETGLYTVASTSNALPHFGDDESESRLVEVIRYGDNDKYIIQRVYYHTFSDEIRPWFERKGLFAQLATLEFASHFEVTDQNKVESALLGDHYNNRGVITSGSVFDITADGNYVCTIDVDGLPTKDTYIVSIRSFDDRKEYDVKTLSPSGCVAYSCYEYYTTANTLVRTPWLNTENIAKSKFDGKILHIFGDGISYGIGASDVVNTSYPGILSNKYGWSIINHSLTDATAASYDDSILAETSLLTQIDRSTGLTTTEEVYVIIAVGGEDYRCGLAAIGSDSYKGDTTYKGALNLAVEKILSRAPLAKIIFATPIYRASSDPSDGMDGDINIVNGKTLREYAEAMVEVAKVNHIPYVDLYNECMINKYNYTQYLNEEGIFPTDLGHSMIAEKIQDAFGRYY